MERSDLIGFGLKVTTRNPNHEFSCLKRNCLAGKICESEKLNAPRYQESKPRSLHFWRGDFEGHSSSPIYMSLRSQILPFVTVCIQSVKLVREKQVKVESGTQGSVTPVQNKLILTNDFKQIEELSFKNIREHLAFLLEMLLEQT